MPPAKAKPTPADEAAAEFSARPAIDLEAEAKRIFAEELAPDPVIREGIAYDQTSGEKLGPISPLRDDVAPEGSYRKRGLVDEPMVPPSTGERHTFREGELRAAAALAEFKRSELAEVQELFAPLRPLRLHWKLAEVMEVVDRIPKRGRAPREMGGFEFVQVGDAAASIRKELAARHITLTPIHIDLVRAYENPTKQGGMMTTETYMVTWQFTDGDTGETHTIQSVGTGADRGDKASPKAQTNAMKYALLMAFLMPTGDDPELEDSSDRQDPSRGGNTVIEDSSVTGVRQGGRQSQTTQAQILEIGRFARRLKLGALALAAVIDGALPEHPVPPFPEGGDAKVNTEHILTHLRSLSHDETGSIIQVLMNSTPAKEDHDDGEAD